MKNYRRHERGSAVILALALLSLMLILIMSFVTNALLDSRIADTKKQLHNVQNIGDIALNRALMSLNFSVAGNGDVGKFDNFVSWAYNDDLPHAASSHNPPTDNAIGNDGYNKYREADSGDSDYEALRMAYDGIKKVMDTKLYNNNDDIYLYRYPTHRDSDDDKITNSSNYWFKGAFSQQPRWIYLYEDSTNTDKIGRFAYAVLPDKGQVNINSLVGGPLVAGDARTGDYTYEFQADQIVVNEYADPGDQEKISNTSDSNIFAKVEKDETNIYAKRGNDISNFINFNISDKRIINALYQKFVFNQNFYPSDGAYPSDGETFYVKGDPNVKSRFNLTAAVSYDNKSVDDIMAALPFLRNIGSSKGNFYSFEDYRKQIAANLIDLGDSDNKPTSDAVHPWTVNSTPTYTGNEMTPYISKMRLNMDVTLDGGVLKNLVFTLRPEFELIDFYKFYDPENPNGEYNLEFNITEFTGDVELTKGEVKTTVTYLDNKFRPQSTTLSIPLESISRKLKFEDINFGGNALTAGFNKTYNESNLAHLKLDNSATFYPIESENDSRWSARSVYLYGTSGLPQFQQNYTIQLTAWALQAANDCRDYAKNHVSGARTILTATPTEITSLNEIQISNVKIGLGNVVLKDSSGNGVDFIKLNKTFVGPSEAANVLTNGFCLLDLTNDDALQNLHLADWNDNTHPSNIDLSGGKTLSFGTLSPDNEKAMEKIYNAGMSNGSKPEIKYSTLQAIHRGVAGEFLEILKANDDINFDNLNRGAFEDFVWKAGVRSTDTGTTYADGDGGILNQIKLNDEAPFKINIATTSKDIWRGLLYGLKYDSDGNGDVNDEDDDIFSDSDLEIFIENIVNEIAADPSILQCRSDLVKLIELANTGLSSGLEDQHKYGIIDGIMHLIKVEQYPEEFQILIVAQSINPNSFAANESEAVTATEKVLVTVRRTGDEFNIIKKEKMPF